MSQIKRQEIITKVRLLLVTVLVGGCLFFDAGVTADEPGELMLVGAVVCLLAGLSLLWRARPIKLTPAYVGLILTVAWAILTVQFSVDKQLSLSFLAIWCLGLGAFLISSSSDSKIGSAREISIAIVLVALSCVHGFAALPAPIKANFTNPDCYSVVVLAAFFAAVSLWRLEHKASFICLLAGAGLLCLSLFFTQCRASLAGLVIGLICLSALARKVPNGKEMTLAVWSTPIAVASLLFATAWLTMVFGRLIKLLGGGGSVSLRARWEVLTESRHLLWQRPLEGFGPGTFHLAFQQVRTEALLGEGFMNVAHNDYVQVAVESGLPGLILFLAFCLGLLRIPSLSGVKSWRASSLAAGWIAIMTYMLGNFALPVASVVVFTFLYAGYLHGSWTTRGVTRTCHPSLIAGLLIVSASYLAWYGSGSLEVKKAQRLSAQLTESLRWEKAFEALEPALARQPGNSTLHTRRATLARRIFEFSGEEKWRNATLSALEAGRLASPLNVVPAAREARTRERFGQYTKAEDLWRSAAETAPANWRLRRGLAINLMLQGRLDEAKEIIAALPRAQHSSQFGGLIAVVEMEFPGEGIKELRNIAQDPRENSQLEEVLSAAVELAKKKNHAPALRSLLELYLEFFPDNLCKRLDWCRLPHHSLASRIEALESILGRAALSPRQTTCRDTALREWAQLKQRNGDDSGPVIAALEDRLREKPGDLDLRLMVSNLYSLRGESSEARTVLREGLEDDTTGTLVIKLGGLFEEGGHLEIALTYYEDALRRTPEDPVLQDKVNRLRSKLFYEQ